MARSVKAGFDEALYNSKLQCRAASPWGRKLECLDVLTSVRSDKVSWLTWLSKFTCGGSSSSGLTSTNVKPTSALVKQASMLDPEWMALGSKWRDADLKNLADLKGFANLEDLSRPSVGKFEKRTLERLELEWNTAKGVSAWLMHIAGMDVGKDETLSGTVDGLVVASVDINLIRKWVDTADAQGAFDWCPDIPAFQRHCSDWEQSEDDQSKNGTVKSLWIVTEVLYATKFTVTGRSGVFASAKAQVAVGVPGVEVKAAITVLNKNDDAMIVQAARNSHFIVGYRVMRLDYNVRDGKLVKTRAPEESRVRGQDDASCQSYLDLMKEDIFEVDEESGETLPIPIFPLSENELKDLDLNKADYTGLQEGTS